MSSDAERAVASSAVNSDTVDHLEAPHAIAGLLSPVCSGAEATIESYNIIAPMNYCIQSVLVFVLVSVFVYVFT